VNDDDDTDEFDRPSARSAAEKRLAAAHGYEKTRSELVAETHRMEMNLLRAYAVHLAKHPCSPLKERYDAVELMELSGYDHRELQPAVNTLRDRLPEDQELSDILPAVVDAAETEVV
jgi:hypothetical protein